MPNSSDRHSSTAPLPLLAVRSAVGGVFMGLANLVPGISGGTMLLAAGVYPEFITGVAEVSTARLRPRSLLVLGAVIVGAAAAIVSLAGIVGDLVVTRRWVMFSLFIGLTLGGVPILLRMLRPLDRSVIAPTVIGIVAMGALAFVQHSGAGSASPASGRGFVMLLIAGAAGGSAMILPGVSGGYLLLILGQYVTILTAIEAARAGASAQDWVAVRQAMYVFVPVGIGVIAGVVGVSNVIKILLDRHERATLGVLLGLLLGAVLGLWPFREPIEPALGSVVKGRVVTAESLPAIEVADWPTALFAPSSGHILGALGLIVAGFLVSTAVGALGRER
jgi:putative membrane protein